MYNHNFYNKELKHFARELRTESVSKAEKYLWKALLSRRKIEVKFLRQRPIKNFIVDFFAPEIGLIVEVDGSSHLNKGDYDFYRENVLKSLGFEIIRFQEGDVLNNLDDVKAQLEHVIYCLKDKQGHLP